MDRGSCSFCSKEYSAKSYKFKQLKFFCSLKCKHDSMRRTDTKKCDYCGDSVVRRKSSFYKDGAKMVFCDKSCHGSWRTVNRKTIRLSSYGKNSKVFQKLFGRSCFICGYDRVVQYCHIIPAKLGGTTHPINIVCLCPNHHALFDKFKLTDDEDMKLDDIEIAAWASPDAINEQVARARQSAITN